MATVLQPWSSGRNVIGGALALNLDQHGHLSQILTIPDIEGFQQLETLTLGVDINLDFASILKDGKTVISLVNKSIITDQTLLLCKMQTEMHPFCRAFPTEYPSCASLSRNLKKKTSRK